MSLIDRSATALLTDLESRKIASVELTRAYLDQIQKHDGKIKAFLLVDPDTALARAKEIDGRRAAGKPVGKLGGLPVAIKDVICTQGVKTTCASKILQNFVPPYDATVVMKLKAADAVLIGTTNMDEFVVPISTASAAFSFITTVASYGGTKFCRILLAQVVFTPCVQITSLIATGNPPSLPTGLPAARRPSISLARASAESGSTSRKALILASCF